MKVNFINEKLAKSGKKNMEEDLKLLNEAIEKKKKGFTVRFYTWAPKCVSFGRNQKETLLGIKEIDTVIRPTGGRALLHDMEVTYSVTGPQKEGESVLQSYKEISRALILGFKKLGIELDYGGERGKNLKYCMNLSSGADICYNGRKLIGSAQFRKQGYFLQHGSILFDADFEFLEKLFMEKIDRNSIVTLKEINDKITKEELIEALIYGFKTKFEHE